MRWLLLLPLLSLALAGCGRAVITNPWPVSGHFERTEVSGDWQRGQQAITHYGCGSCHVIPGVVAARGMVGPPLTRWALRGTIAGALPNTEENLVHWIRDPQSVWPGNDMPNLGVSEPEARDIAAYLYTLR